MKINLLKGSVTYGAVTIFSRVAAVLLIPVLTRLLLPLEYGVLNMVLTVVSLANFVATAEVVQAVTLYFNDTKRPDRDLYPATALKFSLLMYLIILLLAAVSGNFFLEITNQKEISKTVLVFGVMLLAGNGLYAFLQNQFRLEFKTKQYAFLTIGYVLLTSLGAVAGALVFKNRAEGVIFGQAAGALLVDAAGIFTLRRLLYAGISKQRLKEMLKLSLPLVPASFLLLGGQQAAKFVLSSYSTLDNVGIYGLAYQIAGFSALAVLGVQTAITPAVLVNHQQSETPKLLGQLFERYAVVALLFCAFLSVFANELVTVFSTSGYKSAAKLVPPLAFAVALSNLYIFFPGKIIRGKSASQLIASIVSFAVAAGTGFLLVKADGVRGAALSTLFAAAAFFFTWCYISQRLYHLPVNWLKLLKVTLFTVLLCVCGIIFIPAEVSIKLILIKTAVLTLFTYIIARNQILMVVKKIKNTVTGS